jgi:hypothetical protein
MDFTKNEQGISLKQEKMVTLRIKKTIVSLIDKEREKFSTPRSSWIIQAAVEKLEKLGYEIK